MSSPVASPQITCPVEGCARTFTTKLSLRRHRYIHDPSLRVHCHICQKSFGRKDKLSEHLKQGRCHNRQQVTVKVSDSSPAQIKDARKGIFKPVGSKCLSPPTSTTSTTMIQDYTVLDPSFHLDPLDTLDPLDMDPPFHGFGAPGSDDYFQIKEALARREAARGLLEISPDPSPLKLEPSDFMPVGTSKVPRSKSVSPSQGHPRSGRSVLLPRSESKASRKHSLEIFPVEPSLASSTPKMSKRKVLEIIPVQNNNHKVIAFQPFKEAANETKQTKQNKDIFVKQETRKSSRKRKLNCLDDSTVQESQPKRIRKEKDEDELFEESLIRDVTMLCKFFGMF